MRTTLNLNDELMKRAKEKAASEGRTLTSLLEDGLRLVLREHGRDRTPYEFRFPTVCGDRPPAVDIADRDRLYDLMERGDAGAEAGRR